MRQQRNDARLAKKSINPSSLIISLTRPQLWVMQYSLLVAFCCHGSTITLATKSGSSSSVQTILKTRKYLDRLFCCRGGSSNSGNGEIPLPPEDFTAANGYDDLPPPPYGDEDDEFQQLYDDEADLGMVPPELPNDLPDDDLPSYESSSSASFYPSQSSPYQYHQHPAQQQRPPPHPQHPSQQHQQQQQQQQKQPPPLPGQQQFQHNQQQHNQQQQDYGGYGGPPQQHSGGYENDPVPFDDASTSSPLGEADMDLSSFDKTYILKGLARLYRKKILPLEISSKYGHFHSPPLSPSDFEAPPTVLLLGQYSVGKTSFIKYLLGRDFPGIRVGPEPTTDRFTAVLWGPQDKIIPGAALCSQNHRPFTGLNPFGNNFLSRMEGVELDIGILNNVTFIDTPGILSGVKQRAGRNYDYEAVMKWFAERADLIIVMFDAHKLDISDELKRVMELMIPHLDKMRIVLNKADTISTQQLMRVYGALMWSLGKVMNTPEVCRVYMGSFWNAPLHNTEQAELLQREEMDLLNDVMSLPQHAVMRRINELVKRARSVKVHAYIIHYLRKQLPYTWGKREKQHRLIGRLENEFLAAARRYGLPKGDFPPLEPFRQALYEIKDLSEFPKLDKKLIREMDKVFSVDIPDLLDKARNHN